MKPPAVFTIAVTPFLPDGAIDFASIDRMVDAYIERGATGFGILGMMGEAGKLTAEESVAVVRPWSRASAGCRGLSPRAGRHCRAERRSQDAGAAGVIAPPGSLRTDDQILNYFRSVAEVWGRPLCAGISRWPPVQIATSVILQIVEDCPSCVMLKHEDGPGWRRSAPCDGPLKRRADRSGQRPICSRDAARGRRRHDRLRLPGDDGAGDRGLGGELDRAEYF